MHCFDQNWRQIIFCWGPWSVRRAKLKILRTTRCLKATVAMRLLGRGPSWLRRRHLRLARTEPVAPSDHLDGRRSAAHHLLALGPERLGVVGIEGIGADAAAFGEFRHMAVLAIEAAHRIGRGHDAAPDRGRRALRDGFPAEGWYAPEAALAALICSIIWRRNSGLIWRPSSVCRTKPGSRRRYARSQRRQIEFHQSQAALLTGSAKDSA